MSRPLLGVAGAWGAAEIELAHRFDDLHQLVYRRGGLRSSNAAVEEVAKLVLIRLWTLRTGSPEPSTPDEYRLAFARALAEPSLTARDPAGRAYPIWPADEPFRLTEPSLLAAAAGIVADTVHIGFIRVADPLGVAFDALLAGRYDHTGGLGTYLTPSGVARTMAEIAIDLVAAGAGGFGDPFCGTGRFLIAMLAALPADHPLRAAGAFGTDQSAASVAKARINMLLYGVEQPLVWAVRDSITDAGLDAMAGTVGLILTNPPFGDGQYDDPAGVAATAQTLPTVAGRRRIDPALAGLGRCLRLLAPGGVLGIVLPDGILGSDAFEALGGGGEYALDASVSLPTATFALSGTVAKTSAVFLRRGPAPRRVALARVEHVGYVRQAGRPAADPAGDELPGLPALVAAARAADADTPVVTVHERPLVVGAPAGTSGLDPARLDPVAAAARRRLVAAGGVALGTLVSVRVAARSKAITSPFVSVLHIDDLGTIDWTAATSHTPTTAGVMAVPGSLIVSLLNPARLRAAVIPPGPPIQVSAEFGVFACACDPHAVLALLYSPDVRAQLRPLGTGTSSSRRRIDADDVLGLIVPTMDDDALAGLGRAVREAADLVAHGRADLARRYRDAGLR
jgi:SAM-dependent methyltransferase